jgi:transposase
MPKKISITISESIEFLTREYSKSKGILKKDRIKTLLYVKEGKYVFQSSIAKKLGRTEKTIREWLKRYSREGFSSFLRIHSGGNNTRTISEKAIVFISKVLNDTTTTITSYIELQLLIEEHLKEKIHYKALYSHCRRNHKSKLKVSRKSHYKKDEKAEELFKKT